VIYMQSIEDNGLYSELLSVLIEGYNMYKNIKYLKLSSYIVSKYDMV